MLPILGVSDFKYYPNNQECSDIYTGIDAQIYENLPRRTAKKKFVIDYEGREDDESCYQGGNEERFW